MAQDEIDTGAYKSMGLPIEMLWKTLPKVYQGPAPTIAKIEVTTNDKNNICINCIVDTTRAMAANAARVAGEPILPPLPSKRNIIKIEYKQKKCKNLHCRKILFLFF